jgi:hypothetical protein
VQDPAAPIGTLGFDEAEAAKKREGLSKHQRTAADLIFLIRGMAVPAHLPCKQVGRTTVPLR